MNRLANILLQFIHSLGLGKDGVTERAGLVAAFGRLLDGEDDLSVRHIWNYTVPGFFEPSTSLEVSRPNLNHRADWHHLPHFIDFVIGDGDTAVCPIEGSVQAADPPQTVLDAVDFDVASRAYSKLARSFNIHAVRIREVKRAVEAARILLCVDYVNAFGSLVVPDSGLWSQGTATDRDLIYVENLRFRSSRSWFGRI